MKVFILIKFDKRNVGEETDISESIANVLLERGIVGLENPEINIEKKEVKQQKVKKNEKSN